MGSDEDDLSTEGSSDEDDYNNDSRNHHRYQNNGRRGPGLRGRGSLSADDEDRWKPPKGYDRGYDNADFNDHGREGRGRSRGASRDPLSANHGDSFVDTATATTSTIGDSSGGLRPRSIVREIPPHRGSSRRALGVRSPDEVGGGESGEEREGGVGGEGGGASGDGGSLLDVLKPFYMSLKFW